MTNVDWRLTVCGINHETATLTEREPFQIPMERLAEAHALLADQPGVFESVIVSTCNRVEFYLVTRVSLEPMQVVHEFYRDFSNYDTSAASDQFYSHKGKHVAGHLFRVTAGIDSMVLGENQIQGQIREAYSSACAVKTTGKILHRLFHHAFRAGKQARTNTEMGKGACSVSSAAIGLLKEQLDKSARPTVLFVGVNKMISLASSRWSKLHHDELIFANRTAEKAKELATKYRSSGFGLDQLPALLARADIVITCTGAAEPIITDEELALAYREDPNHRLIIMDMAVPRDTRVDLRCFGRVKLFDLEDVKRFVSERQSARRAAIPAVQEIIEVRLAEFSYWYDHARFEVSYEDLEQKLRNIWREEMNSTIDKLDSDLRQEMAEAADRLMQRLARMRLRNNGNQNRPG